MHPPRLDVPEIRKNLLLKYISWHGVSVPQLATFPTLPLNGRDVLPTSMKKHAKLSMHAAIYEDTPLDTYQLDAQ